MTDRDNFDRRAHDDGAPPSHDRESLKDVAARLIDSGKAYARAEVKQRTIWAQEVGAVIKTVAILGVVALFLVFGALVALLVGLVITLSPILTPIGATAAVFVGTMVVVAILGLVARAKLRTLSGGDAA